MWENLIYITSKLHCRIFIIQPILVCFSLGSCIIKKSELGVRHKTYFTFINTSQSTNNTFKLIINKLQMVIFQFQLLPVCGQIFIILFRILIQSFSINYKIIQTQILKT